MAFTFPSSSAPSTPDKGRSNLYANDGSEPSTTPAGLPPSSAASFTPADPPPSSIFGSSQLGSQRSLFGAQSNRNTSKDQGSLGANGGAKSSRSPLGFESNLLASAPKSNGKQSASMQGTGRTFNTQPQDEDEVAEDNESDLPQHDQNQALDENMDMGEDIWQEQALMEPSEGSPPRTWAESGLLGSSVRPYDGYANSARPNYRTRLGLTAAQRRQSSVIPAIASDTAKQLGLPDLHEPDGLILETEDQVTKIYPEDGHLADRDKLLEAALQVVPDTLARLWQRCCNQTQQRGFSQRENVAGIGPPDDAPSFHKAAFVANPLLKLYHPPPAKGRQTFTAQSNKALVNSSFHMGGLRFEESYPKILFDWLEEFHYPFRNVIAGLSTYQPSPASHPNFWDLILSLVLRGRLEMAIDLLSNADFTDASTALDDGMGQRGYSGQGLQLVLKEVNRAIQVLKSCPTVMDGDYDTTNSTWTSFRSKAEVALRKLNAATNEDDEEVSTGSAFAASAVTLASSISDFARSAKKSGKKYPRSVYGPLKELYGILLGQTEELLAASQDWIEASVALTAWWDGEDMGAASQSVASRSSMRLIDANPGAAYRERLAVSFGRVTSDISGKDDTLQIDSSNLIEVALAAIFEGDVEEVLCLLRAWSIPIASAVTEIACQAGWYESAPSNGRAAGLNQEDLMVLSYGQQDDNFNRDDLLLQYSEMLSEVKEFQDAHGETKEGWTVAVEVLNRLENTQVGERRISDLMSRLEVDSDERADSLIHASRSFGLDQQAYKIAERYGDLVAETTTNYGTAIVYYARAHNAKKVKDILDMLISYCLVESSAYPPTDDLDDHLIYLIDRPKDTLQHLRRNDPVAADIVSLCLSGYATLRKFYELRDEGLSDNTASLRPIARKKAAAAALVAVISSSADAIQGGLLDRDSEAVVSVDGLLVLLGEAMPLVDQPTRYLSLPQILVLLRAIEDLQTVHSRVREQCEECLKAAFTAYRGGEASLPAPTDMLKKSLGGKSVGGMGAGSGFALLGSVMAERPNKKSRSKKDEIRRGWDWRKGMKAELGSTEIVQMLRLGLAREVARAWLDGEEL